MKNTSAGVRKILVVEHEPEISPFISKVLNSETVRVDTAYDGEMAERMLQEKDYAHCIIDLETLMAKDKQLYKYMKEKYPSLLNGALFSTGGAVAGDAKVFMEQNGQAILHKPFAPEWLKEIVLNTLGRYKNE